MGDNDESIYCKYNCVFCEYGKRNAPGKIVDANVFLSTDKVLGFLDIQPLVTAAAHILVIPRRHFIKLNEMVIDEESSAALGMALPRVSQALLSSVENSEAFNIVQNNGAAAGQVVDHVHFHIVLRPKGGDKVSDAVKELLVNGPKESKWSLKERMSYSSHVFARGFREELDVNWQDSIVPKLRKLLMDSKL